MTTHRDSLSQSPMVSCACPLVDGAHLSTCSLYVPCCLIQASKLAGHSAHCARLAHLAEDPGCACPMVDGQHLSTCSADPSESERVASAARTLSRPVLPGGPPPRRLVLRFEGTVEELRDWLVQLAEDLETRRWELTGTKVPQDPSCDVCGTSMDRGCLCVPGQEALTWD